MKLIETFDKILNGHNFQKYFASFSTSNFKLSDKSYDQTLKTRRKMFLEK